MKYIKYWIGLCLMLLAIQAGANEITIKDVWVRPAQSGKDSMMVGMVVESEQHARITSIISPAYSSVVMWGPGRGDGKKAQELEYIELPAQKQIELNEHGAHLVLSGNHFKSFSNKITLIISAQLDDGSIKNVTTVAYIDGKKPEAVPAKASPAAAEGASVEAKPAAVVAVPEGHAEKAANPSANAKQAEAESSAESKHAVPSKKIVKNVPAPKPAPIHHPAPVKAAPVPVAVAPAPVLAPPPVPAPPQLSAAEVAAAEAKKELEAKMAEKAKQEEAAVRAECVELARAVRECNKENDMMQDMCVNNARSDSACNLPLDQVRKLR